MAHPGGATRPHGGRPVYLVGPPGPLADAVAESLGLPGERRHADLPPVDDLEPGVVVVPVASAGSDAALDAVLQVGRGRGEWTAVLVVGEEPGALRARVVSAGNEAALDAVRGLADGAEGPLLELRDVVSRISRSRHDINNPLTSALAETQLLLMDVEDDGDLREGLETIETQLRRIRDMVAGLTPIRHSG